MRFMFSRVCIYREGRIRWRPEGAGGKREECGRGEGPEDPPPVVQPMMIFSPDTVVTSDAQWAMLGLDG